LGGSGKAPCLADGLSLPGRNHRQADACRCHPENQPAKEAEFATGQLVRHKIFGLGRVKKYVDLGANSVVTIQFNSGQTKSLLLQYANLTKM
jgi:hypothetical protein